MRKELDKTGTIFSRFIGHLPGMLTAYLRGFQILSRRDSGALNLFVHNFVIINKLYIFVL